MASGVSIVIPAFNEELAIANTIRAIRAALDGPYPDHEIVVVNDGSQDRTEEIALGEDVMVVSLPDNRGYGAALKAGITRSKNDTIAIIDADGTYPVEALPELLDALGECDMVVGARVRGEVAIPRVRQPAKWFLKRLASYVTKRKIPDLNSGLRVMRRDLVERFEHLLPSGFSFTTTITMASLSTDSLVRFVPIAYGPRVGSSKIRSRHAFDFLVLVLRMAVYFNPLRVFLPVCAALTAVGLIILALGEGDTPPKAAWAFFLCSGIVAIAGLLFDQVARISLRRGGFR